MHGKQYKLDLTENVELVDKLPSQQRFTAARHYKGTLPEIDGSWVRVSNIGGNWSGLVSLDGAAHVIKSEISAAASSSLAEPGKRIQLAAQPVANYDHLKCGVAHVAKKLVGSATHSALSTPAPVAYEALCERTVSDVCVLAEAEFAFDRSFQQAIPTNAMSEALAMINMTEGIYRNDLKILFDTLSIRMQGFNEISNSSDPGVVLDDILDRRQRGELAQDLNDKSLFHFVTGRDFDDDTVGIAYFDTLCSTAAIGTSQTVRRPNNSVDLPLTALVMAHEIGHNFGANHDVDENACSAGFVMDAALQDGARDFSSCSIDQVEAAISKLPDVRACFNFPFAMNFTGANDNVFSVGAGQTVTHNFTISVTEGYQPIETMLATVFLHSDEGRFEAASLDGLPCSIAPDGWSFECPRNDPTASHALNYTLRSTGSSTSLGISYRLSAIGNADSDLSSVARTSRDLDITMTVAQHLPVPASDLSAIFGDIRPGFSVNLVWSDNSDNEDGFIVQRRVDGGSFSRIGTNNVPRFLDTTTSVENHRYEYRVAAFNALGKASFSNIAQAELSVPQEVRFLRAAYVNDAEVHLSWAGLGTNNEDGVRIERSIDGGDFFVIGNVDAR